MIKLNKNSSVPQNYTSVERYLYELQKESSSIIELVLGTGLASVDISDLAPHINVSTTVDKVTVTSDFTDTVYASYKIYGSPLNGMLATSKLNGVLNEKIVFDEAANILNGSLGNPIKVGYLHYTHSVSGWSVDNIASVIYVNGTPQPADNIAVISTDAANREAQIGFRKVIGGLIYPDPIKPDGGFSDKVLRAVMDDWFTDFGDPIVVTFSDLDLMRTKRPLILELYDIDSSTRKFFLVSPEFQTGKPYYEALSKSTIAVHIPSEIRAEFPTSSTVTRLYFVDIAELTNFGGDNKFYRQYKLPVDNLLPDNSDLKIFAISKSTGEVIELVSESNTLLGDLYGLDYRSGILNIFNIEGKIPADSYIAVGGYKYEPPIKPSNVSDYVNTIQIWHSAGGVYELSSPPEDTLYLYLVPEGQYEEVISYVDAGGRVITAPRVQLFKLDFIITDTDITDDIYSIEDSSGAFGTTKVKPILLGTLTRSGLSYTFIPNPAASSPYSRLLDLAANLSLITANSFTTEKVREILRLPITQTLIVPIDYIHPNATEIAFYGLTGKLLIKETSSSTLKSWQIELGYYDHGTNVFTPLITVGSGTSSVNNGFVNLTSASFPAASLWGTTSPNTDKFLALRVQVTDISSGESEYEYDYSLSIYLNIKY